MISASNEQLQQELVYSLLMLYFDLRPGPKILFQGDTPEGSDTFQWPVIERDRVGGLRIIIWDKVLFTNPSARAGYDTRSNF